MTYSQQHPAGNTPPPLHPTPPTLLAAISTFKNVCPFTPDAARILGRTLCFTQLAAGRPATMLHKDHAGTFIPACHHVPNCPAHAPLLKAAVQGGRPLTSIFPETILSPQLMRKPANSHLLGGASLYGHVVPCLQLSSASRAIAAGSSDPPSGCGRLAAMASPWSSGSTGSTGFTQQPPPLKCIAAAFHARAASSSVPKQPTFRTCRNNTEKKSRWAVLAVAAAA